MAKCIHCGKRFDVDEAREMYNDEFSDYDTDYDEEWPEGNMCGKCAMEITAGDIQAGEDYEFELRTGRPYYDRDEDDVRW